MHRHETLNFELVSRPWNQRPVATLSATVTLSSVSTAPALEIIIEAAEARLSAIAKVVPAIGWLTRVLAKTIAEYVYAPC